MPNVRELFSPRLQPSDAIPSPGSSTPDPKDRANLITDVYTKLGIFNPAQAEQAPELLQAGLKEFYAIHPNTESYVSVNLTPSYGQTALIAPTKSKP